MKLAFLLAFTCLFPHTSEALLSPYYQSIVEIKAIFDSPELEKQLGQRGPITSITKNEEGYLFSSEEGSVQVNVSYKSDENIGPKKFNLQFVK